MACDRAHRSRSTAWHKGSSLTPNATHNHTYVRRPLNAHPNFYALWADGNPLDDEKTLHTSRLYFTTKSGSVFTLPETMTENTAKPALFA